MGFHGAVFPAGFRHYGLRFDRNLHQGTHIMSVHPQSLAVRTPAGPFPLLLALLLAVGCLTAVLPAVTVAAEAAPVAIGPYDARSPTPPGAWPSAPTATRTGPARRSRASIRRRPRPTRGISPTSQTR